MGYGVVGELAKQDEAQPREAKLSLLSIIRDEKVRIMFREAVTNPGLPCKHLPLKIPPRTNRYSLLGIAFDYLLRFMLKREYSIATDKPWVAWNAICYLKDVLPAVVFTDFLGEYYHAEIEYRKFLHKGQLSKRLAESCLFLAYIEPVVRSESWLPTEFPSYTSDEVRDLLSMARRTDLSLFEPKECLLLNPGFWSADLVGGADADIIVDDTLIDVKTTKHRVLDRRILNQLIGYYLLSRRDKLGIKKVGIYWSRYLRLDVWKVRDLATQRQFSQLQREFELNALITK